MLIKRLLLSFIIIPFYSHVLLDFSNAFVFDRRLNDGSWHVLEASDFGQYMPWGFPSFHQGRLDIICIISSWVYSVCFLTYHCWSILAQDSWYKCVYSASTSRYSKPFYRESLVNHLNRSNRDHANIGLLFNGFKTNSAVCFIIVLSWPKLYV